MNTPDSRSYVDATSPFAAALDDAECALAEAIEALQQASEAAPKGPGSKDETWTAGLVVGLELVQGAVRRRLGQAVGKLDVR